MVQTGVKAQVFKLRAQLLSKGRKDTVLADSDLLQVRMKVYATGGENTLHAHTSEDHTFIVLQGKAVFYDEADVETVVGRHEGILLPIGSFYWFRADEAEPLVMIREGARGEQQEVLRIGGDGKPLPGDSHENKHVTPEFIPGAFFE